MLGSCIAVVSIPAKRVGEQSRIALGTDEAHFRLGLMMRAQVARYPSNRQCAASRGCHSEAMTTPLRTDAIRALGGVLFDTLAVAAGVLQPTLQALATTKPSPPSELRKVMPNVATHFTFE